METNTDISVANTNRIVIVEKLTDGEWFNPYYVTTFLQHK